MMSAYLFARTSKGHIALPCQWKKEWSRTISSSGFDMKENREGDKENIGNSISKQSDNVRNKRNRIARSDVIDGGRSPSWITKHKERVVEKSQGAESTINRKISRKVDTPLARFVQPSNSTLKHIQRIMETSQDAESTINRRIDRKVDAPIAKPIQAPVSIQRHILKIMGEESDELSKKSPIDIKRLTIGNDMLKKHVEQLKASAGERSQDGMMMDKDNMKQRVPYQKKRTGRAGMWKGPPPEAEDVNDILEVLNNVSPDEQTSSETASEAENALLDVWNKLNARDLETQVTHSPRSAFEEMIAWTEKGTLWKFPINNEEGMVEEENVHFSEHIFLDQHLDEWCPTTGPIRHYMELVCLGLSKNPYYTVEEKVRHIMWYKNYFTNQIALLEDLGVWSQKSSPESEETHDENEKQQQLA